MFKKISSLVVIIAVLSLFTFGGVIGCATQTWQQTSTQAFVTSSIVANQVKTTAQKMCSEGQLTVDQCTKIKSIYNQVVAADKVAAQALITSFYATDAIAQQNSLAAYQVALSQVGTLVAQLVALAQSYNIKF